MAATPSTPPPAPHRRNLRFSSPQEAIDEAERIAAAERQGTLRRTGQWTAGQCLGHVAAWIDYGFDGYPIQATPEAAARARGYKATVLKDGMTPGYRITGMAEGTAGTDPLSTEEGLRRFKVAWDRLGASAPAGEHAFFGPMTHEEWKQLNLRHAELHMGFLHPHMEATL